MKKIAAIIIITVSIIITAIIVLWNFGSDGMKMQHSVTIGEFKLSDAQTWEWVTDTPITDHSAKLLKEKYGRDFVCSYFLYHEEYCLHVNFKAAPADDPHAEFYYNLDGSGGLSADHYVNMMYMDEITEWLREGISIPEAKSFVVYPTGSLTEEEAVSKRFVDRTLDDGRSYCQHGFSVIILIDPDGAEKLDSRCGELMRVLRERLGCEFCLDIGTESYYDPSRPSGDYGGACLGSKLDYDELLYTYLFGREGELVRMVGKAARSEIV